MIKFSAAILLISSIIFAQGTQDMEDMMQDMQKIQACMAKIDFNTLAGLQEKSFSVQKEVEDMCKNKQRDKAQERAIRFSNEVMSYPAIVQLKECSKGSAMDGMLEATKTDFKNHHVCDGMNIDFGMPNSQRIQW
ncbi:MAG: hypothetical protein COA44_10285 [Arcobacter sp.]|nr:MAG: hypothetical protein COA44_10285 [Arcobacter sp.]